MNDLEAARARVESRNFIKHEEPKCDGSCGVKDPHRHGFSCFKSCDECGAFCHPSCPAFKEKKSG